MSEHAKPPATLEPILARRAEFRAFLIARLGSEADADDVLQNVLVKALRRVGEVRDEEKITSWFYQALRHAMVDHIRGRQARERREVSWAASAITAGDAEMEKLACRCVEALIAELKPREAELVRRVELDNEPVADAAKAAGISPNSASVTLHRVRKKLREGLEKFCADCAADACLDCDCASPKSVGG